MGLFHFKRDFKVRQRLGPGFDGMFIKIANVNAPGIQNLVLKFYHKIISFDTWHPLKTLENKNNSFNNN